MRHFEYVPAEFRKIVADVAPDCIFNLVESVSGTSRLIHVPPIYIEEINLPYTGSPSHGLELSERQGPGQQDPQLAGRSDTGLGHDPLLKDTEPVTHLDRQGASLACILRHHAEKRLSRRGTGSRDRQDFCTAEHRIPWLIEEFVAAANSTCSVVETPDGPRALPVAEIVFESYGPDRQHRRLTTRTGTSRSFEYRNTVRRYDFPPSDTALLQTLQEMAVRTWHGFGLRGWARVDFRVDASSKPW
jgi:D-alanine-D-alanine ligase